jgi:hypothetical protein
MTQQYGRLFSLTVAQRDNMALDLSDFRVQFSTRQTDTQTPNSCVIRVFNLNRDTVQRIQKEFTRVTLQAGYPDNFGIIFDGTIKQFRRGKLNATDTYLDVLAADGDLPYNYAVVNTSLAAGSTPADRVAAAAKPMEALGATPAQADAMGLTGGVLPRGKVMYGMSRAHLRDIARTTGTTWSIQNGKVVMIPLEGYLPNEAVVLTSDTGLIGMPEQTEDGIHATALLNPRLTIGTRVQIANSSINQLVGAITEDGQTNVIPYDQWKGFTQLATVRDDGLYRVLVAEHSGDTLGTDWYTNIVCLAIDPVTGTIGGKNG